mmetsp:Transcript_51130/g.121496  ORF Transcript_51130/g.121496 Transcript_51130/m.121496 type:complete len:109 (+) Transcript_51130:389-715(+)
MQLVSRECSRTARSDTFLFWRLLQLDRKNPLIGIAGTIMDSQWDGKLKWLADNPNMHPGWCLLALLRGHENDGTTLSLQVWLNTATWPSVVSCHPRRACVANCTYRGL